MAATSIRSFQMRGPEDISFRRLTANRARKLFRHFSDIFYEHRKDSPLRLHHGSVRSRSSPSALGSDDDTIYPGCLPLHLPSDKGPGRSPWDSTSTNIGYNKPILSDRVTSAEPESIQDVQDESRQTRQHENISDLSRYTETPADVYRTSLEFSHDWRGVTLFEELFTAPAASDKILQLKGGEAQRFLDFGDWVLTELSQNEIPDMSDERWARLRQTLRRLVVRLIQLTSLVPYAMYIRDISIDQDPDRMATRLGSGAYADVYAGRWSRITAIPVAVKVFRPLDNFDGGEIRSEDHLLRVFLREVAIQRYLEHPNICRPLGVLAEPAPHSPMSIVFPRMLDGNIAQYLRKHPEIKPSQKYAMYLGLAQALAYIHGENIVHGDIHGGNVLVNAGTPQLADFGVANFADSTTASVSLTRTGASRWMAPEILRAEQEDGPVRHTRASDVFSFGMLMLQMHTGELPFAGLQPGRIKYKIMNGERPARPENIDDALWRILQDCWRHEPEERPSAESLVARLEVLRDRSAAQNEG